MDNGAVRLTAGGGGEPGGRWDEGGQAADELERREHQMSAAVLAGAGVEGGRPVQGQAAG